MSKIDLALGYILPFRTEDNMAWDRATKLERALFFVYIFAAACRTVMVYLFMAILVVPVSVEESRAGKRINAWLADVFNRLFVRQNKAP